ncbi:MAG: hypothetical protein K8L99_27810 [Anaerolineae bacterium]|nr:hypothetical protein [Anaerolineae bacterium]
MNLEAISQKQLSALEQQVRQLLIGLRKAKLDNEPLVASLQQLEERLGQVRRERFDAANSEYHTY